MKAVHPNSAIEAQVKSTIERIKQGICIGNWIDEIALKELFRYSDTTISNYCHSGLIRHKKFGGRLFFDLAHIILTLESAGTQPSVARS